MLSCSALPDSRLAISRTDQQGFQPHLGRESYLQLFSYREGSRTILGALSLLLITALLTGCGFFGGDRDRADPIPGEVTPNTSGIYIDDTYLHVRLEPRDESRGSVPPNDHPVEISGAQIEALLANIQVKPENGDEPIPLIPAKQLTELSIIVAQALGDAKPDEDVVFHSFQKAGSWFGSSRRATTARVFYRDGALNLIFGDLDDFYSEQIDRSLQPLEPGYRNKLSELGGKLVASPQIAFVDDRADWIRIDTTSIATVPPVAQSPASVSPATVSPPNTPATAAQAGQTSQDPRWAQLEERLLILDGLRRKGLITEEDYETKKQELLEVLDL